MVFSLRPSAVHFCRRTRSVYCRLAFARLNCEPPLSIWYNQLPALRLSKTGFLLRSPGSSSMSLDTLIIITISCWGIWGIFDKLALQSASHRDVLLMLFLLFLPQVPLVWLLVSATAPGWHPTADVLFWTGLAASAYTLSMVAYLAAMSKAEASYVLGITASYPLVLQLLAVALLGETLVVNRLLGAALIGAGVFAIGASNGG